LLLVAVDSARVLTPGVLRKTRDEFERWGNEIVTTTIPYHFYKHSSTLGFTVEECRREFLKTRWKQDFYHLFNYTADTYISTCGVPNESTWLGITKENFLKAGGHNEFFTEWSEYNLDLFRRLTKHKPEGDKQEVGIVNSKWGKVGLGLEVHVLEGEADFHLHHSLSDAKRNPNVLVGFRKRVWNHYAEVGDCIVANKLAPNWGKSSEAEEITFK